MIALRVARSTETKAKPNGVAAIGMDLSGKSHTEPLIVAILGQYHIRGKKDYAAHRESRYSREDCVDRDDLSAICVGPAKNLKRFA